MEELPARKMLCIRCGYDLEGLSSESLCPECGVSVERSIRGDQLRWREPAYVKRLHTGATFIQWALSLILLALVLMLVVPTIAASNPRGAALVITILPGVGAFCIVAGMILYPIGWLFLAARDPGRTDDEKGQRSRRLVRGAVWFLIASNCLVAALTIGSLVFVRSTTLSDDFISLMKFVSGAVQLTGFLVWIVQYYASMAYLRWLAERIPSQKVFKRAKLLMWLGPILFLFSCFFIPALIAVVLYYNMLSWIRTELKAIRSEQLASAA